MNQVGRVEDGVVECLLCTSKRKKRYSHFGWFTMHVNLKHVPLKDGEYMDVRWFFVDDDIVYMYTPAEMSDAFAGKIKIHGIPVGSYRGINP